MYKCIILLRKYLYTNNTKNADLLTTFYHYSPCMNQKIIREEEPLINKLSLLCGSIIPNKTNLKKNPPPNKFYFIASLSSTP